MSDAKNDPAKDQKNEKAKAAKVFAYECHCKGVGRHTIRLESPDASAEAEQLFRDHFGIIATDHPIVVGEPVEVAAE